MKYFPLPFTQSSPFPSLPSSLTSVMTLMTSVCFLMISCQKGEPPSKNQDIKKSNTSTSGVMIDGETYQVFLPLKKVTSNNAQQSLRVLPKPTFKVNKDFPHRLKTNTTPTIEFSKNQIPGEIKGDTLTYPLSFKVKSGEHTVQVEADFSICNDKMCKLYQAQKFEWKVQAL